jgi:hypothetical protein
MAADDDNAHCRMLPDYRVEHWDCTDYPDGTITNVITGEVVTS